MNNNEAQQVLSAILEQATEGESSEFRFITSWADFKECFISYKSTKVVIKILKKASKRLFKTYCKDVISGISDITKLLAYSQLDDVIDYYKKELKTLDDMLNEYEDYLRSGNILYALMGGERF
jgi:hypothetical protein